MVASAQAAEKSVLVLIPAFNEGAAVVEVANAVLRLGPRFRPLVVDDGSDPPLASAALPPGTLFFRSPFNAGIGVATHVAFDHMLAHGYDFMARLDGDGQHPAERIPDLLAPLAGGDADLTAGERVNRSGGAGLDMWLRRLAKGYYSAVSGLLTAGRAPIDVNTGFFAATRDAVARLASIDLERFPEPQMFVSACRLGLRVKTVPIEQLSRVQGNSSLNFARALAMFYRFNLFCLEQIVEIGRSWSARS